MSLKDSCSILPSITNYAATGQQYTNHNANRLLSSSDHDDDHDNDNDNAQTTMLARDIIGLII